MLSWGCHPTKIFFLTKYLCGNSLDFLGPIGERYAGLYYSFMERFHLEYDFYWYSGEDALAYEYNAISNTLRQFRSKTIKNSRFSLIKVLFSFSFSNLRSRKIFVVSYPYFPKSLLLASLLFLLKPFRIKVIVDVQDLPRETPGTVGYALWRIIDELYYLHAVFILNATECAKLYAARAHGRTFVIPMATHHQIITPRAAGGVRKRLTLGYIGTIGKTRGVPQLIEVVKQLRAEGFAVDLIINGSNPEHMNLGAYSWLQLYELQPLASFLKLLQSIDVGVIPYVDKEYWGRMSITKMATYMAAGLPVLSLHLTETANILAKWECGISVNNWEAMASAIKRFCKDKSLLDKMGTNARQAALEEYNWSKQVERLGVLVASLR